MQSWHAAARYYVTMDILRRVLEDYFGYTTTFVMNVTDVDDKIIRRARLNHLLQQYLARTPDTAKVPLLHACHVMHLEPPNPTLQHVCKGWEASGSSMQDSAETKTTWSCAHAGASGRRGGPVTVRGNTEGEAQRGGGCARKGEAGQHPPYLCYNIAGMRACTGTGIVFLPGHMPCIGAGRCYVVRG